MTESELTRIEVEAEHAEDTKTLTLVREIRSTRDALRRYLQAHVDAVHAFGTKANRPALDELWAAYFDGWDVLNEPPPHVDQLL